MSQLSDQLRHRLGPEQIGDQNVRKVIGLMSYPEKLSALVHDQIEAWVNEGGAGGEDDAQLFDVMFPRPL
jgi:hypothetical protein